MINLYREINLAKIINHKIFILSMKEIILDTNFLFIPFQFKVDIFSELAKVMNEPYEVYILEQTINELNNIVKTQKGKNREYALMALKLIEKKRIKQKSLYMFPLSKTVDDILVEISDKNIIIATQDKELKKRLKSRGIQTIILRSKKYLELI